VVWFSTEIWYGFQPVYTYGECQSLSVILGFLFNAVFGFEEIKLDVFSLKTRQFTEIFLHKKTSTIDQKIIIEVLKYPEWESNYLYNTLIINILSASLSRGLALVSH